MNLSPNHQTMRGVNLTNKQTHRTCVRMGVKEYELLKKKGASAGLSANAWLMLQLNTNRPTLHREDETWNLIRFMDQAGREINAISREFNSGYGTETELRRVVQLLCNIFEHIHELRKVGYPYAQQTDEN